MTTEVRLTRGDVLYRLLTKLRGDDFGGHPECAETDPELFHPITEHATGQIRLAKEICARCPVAESCLELALRDGERGVWGGTTETERRRLRRDRGVEGGSLGVAA